MFGIIIFITNLKYIFNKISIFCGVKMNKVKTNAKVYSLVEVDVCGIPAQAVVTTFNEVMGSHSRDAPSDLDYYGYTEIEFDLHDRKGYRAYWLENKMRKEDAVEKVEEQIRLELSVDEQEIRCGI